NVPAAQNVVPGAPVSIVLKVDQPTGRQVQGIVGEVLTNGNHPHGIKVRLRDGRVGRVQQLVDEATARAASEGLQNLGRNGDPGRKKAQTSEETNDLSEATETTPSLPLVICPVCGSFEGDEAAVAFHVDTHF
ncbi:hypothetical protein EJ06DRAFT_462215, partial [Trichodelitschia bisporula]